MTQTNRDAPAASAYERAGVSIDAGHRAVSLMKDAVARTHTPAVLGGLGGFGGLFSASAFAGLADPVLVASTDGVGTKTKVAVRLGQPGGLGADIVNHCVNDILVQGARPLFFLDYVAMGRLDPEAVAAVVTGAAGACEALGVALLGGETAEMPGVYVDGELDIVGTIVGVVDRPALVDGSRIEAGDAVIALPSAGLHTNGFSLARLALDGLDWHEERADLDGQTLAALLPVPHRAYVAAHDALKDASVDVRGMAHITGGGLIDNPPRVFPPGVGMTIDTASWTVPPLFRLIVREAQVERAEAFRALNMGVGFLFIVPAAEADAALSALRGAGEQPWVIGEMVAGEGVTLGGIDGAGADGGDRLTSSTKPRTHKGRLAPFGFTPPDRRSATEFWVVRHGESTWNTEGRYQGQADVPLSHVGILQAASLAERLTGQHFDAVYTSDLRRAAQTAEAVAERLEGPPPVQGDPGLREIDVGELSGLVIADIRERHPDYLEALKADPWATRRPGGESMEDLYARSGAAFEALRARHPGGRVLVFTHGGVVRVAVGLALGGVPANAWARLSVTNTSITRVLLGENSGTLLGFNDDAHLEDLIEATEADDVLGQTQ